jgi:hypothetical protein
MKRGKIFANYTSDKRLVIRIYKELLRHSNKNKLIEKWAKDLNRYFPQEDMQVVKEYTPLIQGLHS